MKKIISLLCALLLTVSTAFAGLPGKAYASAVKNPPTNFKQLSWTDFTGLEYKEYAAPNPDLGAKGTYSGDLNQTLLNGNVIMGSDVDIRFAGAGWTGVMIRTLTDGTLYVENSTFDTSYNGTYQPGDYGLTSFIGNEFNLKISTEISENNYTFGIWVNNKMLGDYFTLTEATEGEKGTSVGFFKRDHNNSITLKEVPEITPPTDFTEISWTDFAGMECKEYVKPDPDGTGAKGTYSASLHQTLLNGNIIMGSDTDIRFAGSNGWAGLMIRTLTDGTLYVENSTFDTSYNGTYQPADYGLTSFIGNEFNLKISTEISGDNYTFGIWVNDKILGDYFTLAEADVNEKGNVLGLYHRGSGKNITLIEVQQDAPPVDPPVNPIEPPTDFTEISWTDFTGLECKEYAAPNPDGNPAAKGTYSAGLHQTLLNGNIIMGSDTDIRFAGSNGWAGLNIIALTDGRLQVINSTYDTAYDEVYEASDYGLTSFVGNEFNLKISTEISGNDYTFGIWVNDKILGDYFTLVEADVNEKGNVLGLYHRGSNHNITLKEAPQDTPPVDPPANPIEPPTDFTEISWTDFTGLECKEYVKPNPDGSPNAKGTYSAGLHQTLLNGNIIMGSDTDIRFAGSNGWAGLNIIALSDGRLQVINSTYDTAYDEVYEASDYGLTSFVGNEFNLKISTEISGNDYTFGIWVNDKILGDYFTLAETDVNEKGNVLGLYHRGSNNNITLKEAPQDTPPVNPPVNPIEPPTDFTEISWTDFTGLEYKEYVKPDPDGTGAKGTYSASLHQTLLNGNIIMGSDTDIRFAGSNGWAGLNIIALSDGRLQVINSTYDTAYDEVYEASDYGLTSFVGNEFNLKISTEISGDNYTFGIWVNDIILGDYFTLTEANAEEKGNALGLYHRGSGKNITLIEVQQDAPPVNPPVNPPVEPIEPPTDFTELSWTSFGFTCKEYPAISGNLAGKGTYLDSLHETLLDGDIIFGKGTDIRYAGTGWSGIVLEVAHDGSVLYVSGGTFDDSYSKEYYPADYGLTSFADTEFNLKISTEIEGDNYTFGIWVEDKILGDYFTLTKTANTDAGTSVGLYDRGSNNSITLVGEPEDSIPTEPIPVPNDFEVVTLDDFGGSIRPGALSSNAAIAGQLDGKDDFDELVFSADVNLSTKTPGDATYIRFAGSSKGWVGIGLETKSDGTLVLLNWRNEEIMQSFTKEVAGFDFFKEAFNLKMSFEYVDSDKDGNKDDVRIGVYFNDVLYNNELVVARDYEMTNYLLAFTDDGEAHPLEINNPKKQNVVPIQPDEDLKKISFSSFGIEDAAFTDINVTDFCTSGAYRDLMKGKTLDGTLFHGKVKFGEKGGAELRFGGLTTAWLGLRITGHADGTIVLTEAELNAPEKQFSYLFNPYEAGCELVGTWLDLKISTQFVDSDNDGVVDDVKLGIWFNDVLYQNEYIYLCNYAPHMGSYLSVYSSNEEGYISIQSVEVDNTIELTLFGFDDSYKAHFKTSEKDTVKGVPLGVTAEYDTVDYGVKAMENAVEQKQDAGNTLDGKSETVPYVTFIAAGVILVILSAGCIFLYTKKRKKQEKKRKKQA